MFLQVNQWDRTFSHWCHDVYLIKPCHLNEFVPLNFLKVLKCNNTLYLFYKPLGGIFLFNLKRFRGGGVITPSGFAIACIHIWETKIYFHNQFYNNKFGYCGVEKKSINHDIGLLDVLFFYTIILYKLRVYRKINLYDISVKN